MAVQSQGTPSVLSSVGLALLGSTCCALPISLVAFGAGGAVASLVSAAPWLIALSKYKAWTFGVTALVQAYAWWRLQNAVACGMESSHTNRWQRRALIGSMALLGASVLAAYALLPITQWLGLSPPR